MDNQELQIQGVDGIWRTAVVSDVIAYNFQATSINDLSVRKANYSQNIKLPIVPENLAIFGLINASDVDTLAPYQRFPARIYSGGYTIAPEGSFCIILRVSKYIEVSVYSGIASFFDLAKDKALTDVPLGSIPRSLDAVGNVSDLWFYPTQSAFTLDSPDLYFLSFAIAATVPFVRINRMLAIVVQSLGYTYTVRSNNAKDLSYYALSLAGLLPVYVDYSQYAASSTGITGSAARVPMSVVNSGNGALQALTIPDGTVGVAYTFPTSGRLEISIDVGPPLGSGDPINLFIGIARLDSSGTRVESIWYRRGYAYTDSTGMDGTAGERFFFFAEKQPDLRNLNIHINANFTFSTEDTGDEAPIGSRISIAENLKFGTAFDFIKFVTDAFGYLVYADDIKKTVTFYDYGIIDTTTAKNWSDKVQAKGKGFVSKAFANSNYAQVNILRAEHNEKDNLDDYGSVNIQDATLSREKEWIQLSIESGVDRLAPVDTSDGPLHLYLASIPAYRIHRDDETSPWIYEYDSSFGSHLVEIEKTDGVDREINVAWRLRIDDSSDDPIYAKRALTKVVRTVDIAALVQDRYAFLQNEILQKYLQVTERLLLTAGDVDDNDLFKVVYLEKYGKFFLVNEIKNFYSGKLTETQLIKI